MKQTMPHPPCCHDLRIADDAAFGDAEESYIEIVETLALRSGQAGYGFAVCGGEVALLFDLGDARVAVVRRIAEDDEDGVVLLDVLGVFALSLELLEDVGLGMALGNPAGEGVGEEDSGAVLVGEGSAGGFQQSCDLEVGDDERRGHDFKAEDAG